MQDRVKQKALLDAAVNDALTEWAINRAGRTDKEARKALIFYGKVEGLFLARCLLGEITHDEMVEFMTMQFSHSRDGQPIAWTMKDWV